MITTKTHLELVLQFCIEAVSFFPTLAMLWVLLFCVTCTGHYAPSYKQDTTHHNARNSAVANQRGNRSNNKLGRHFVGTLTSHWQPLFWKNLSNSNFYTWLLTPACKAKHVMQNESEVVHITFWAFCIIQGKFKVGICCSGHLAVTLWRWVIVPPDFFVAKPVK